MSLAERITRHYGGDWNAGASQGNIPGDGHSTSDRSVSVKDAPDKPDGILVHCHAAGDWRAEMSRFRRDGLLDPFEPAKGDNRRRAHGLRLKPGQKITETWEWRKAGRVLYRTHRVEPGASGRGKEFRYDRPDGKGGWLSGRGDGEYIPYRHDELASRAGPGTEIYMAEGERKADRLAEWGLLATSSKHWRPEFGELLKGALVVILPDNDEPGREIARRAFRNVTATGAKACVVELPGLPPAGDILDWSGSSEDLDRLVTDAVTAPPAWLTDAAGHDPQGDDLPDAGITATLPFFWFNEALPSLDANDFVEGLLTSTAMSVVYGPSNCGKTFFIVDLGLHVAWGREWRGRAVDRGAVVYLSLEGSQGIRNRLAAFRKHHGLDDVALPFVVMPRPVNLLNDDADVSAVIALVRHVADLTGLHVAMVIIDTLSRAMAGGNENSAEDMTTIVGNCDRIRAATGAHVCIVHHSGKDEARGARGHSSLRAATDTEIEIKRDPELTVSNVRVAKQRDLEAIEPFAFALHRTALGTNRRGKDVTSCVVIEAEKSVSLARDPNQLSPQEAQAISALEDCITASGIEVATGRNNDVAGGVVAAVAQASWKKALQARDITARNNDHVARTQFARLRKSLENKGQIGVAGDNVWRVQQ